eukprot:TRINITY_DN8020_c0_g1_i1.p1 TRINITY_DN8020_c0_g1~~TRINITY_DN8020_c0_g1_i1.p1  ORF type:complete len:638 (-),score=117.52 TRINITY_DN8020_c0_g1_i1:183-2096(-)
MTEIEMKEMKTMDGPNIDNKEFKKDRPEGQWAELFPPPEEPILMEWKNIVYTISKNVGKFYKPKRVKRFLINDMSGYVQPGELCVILGPSGAGKTTLLNILAGRLSHRHWKGEVTVNGHRRNRRTRQNQAFVLQEDIFLSELSVAYTLNFTAQMVLSNTMNAKQKKERAEKLIDLFKLRKCHATSIGNHLKRGVSGGEKKRLNIANELMKGSALVLLDEPTSGLDSSTAMDVVSMLSQLAKTGRTIVTTLHQPSSQAFYMFDKVILLSDGRMAYIGPPLGAVAYFSRLGYECPAQYNPADYLLELVDEDVSSGERSYKMRDGILDSWIANKEKEMQPPANVPPAIKDAGKVLGFFNEPKWPTNYFQQFYHLFFRAARQYIPTAIGTFITFFIIAVLSAMAWFQMGHGNDDVGNRIGLIFFILLHWIIFPLFGVVNSFIPERAVLIKERAAGTYRLSAYFISKALAESIIDTITPVAFVASIYYICNLNNDADRFFIFMSLVYLAFFAGQSFGLVFAAGVNKVEHASPFIMVAFFVGMLVSGFFVDGDNIPEWFAWVKYIDPLKYLLDAAIINEFDGTTFNVKDVAGNTVVQTGDQIIDGIDPIFRKIYPSCLIVLAFAFAARLLAYCILRITTTPTK